MNKEIYSNKKFSILYDKMKFENKKIIIYLIIIVISILLLLFVNNDDFLYKKNILKITKITEISKEESVNPIGYKEIHKDLKIEGIITNGKYSGENKTFNYEETYSSVVTEKYKVGDKVFLESNNIDGLKRDTYIVFMLILLVISLIIVGKYKGLLSIISVVLNIIIFCIGIDLYFRGINLLLIVMIISILESIISLYIVSGKNKKTMSAIISVIISLTVLFILSFLIGYFTDYSNINFNEISFVTVPVTDFLLPSLMIGGMGAIMDVAITMSSSISELINKDKTISSKILMKSGKKIGQDIMSTMINVLFFTYICGELPIFILALRNGFSFYNYISTSFSLEITRFLIGSIGILLAIPISLFIAIKIFKRSDINE